MKETYVCGDWSLDIHYYISDCFFSINNEKIDYIHDETVANLDTDSNVMFELFDDGYTVDELADEDVQAIVDGCREADEQFPSEFESILKRELNLIFFNYYNDYYLQYEAHKEDPNEHQ